MSSQIVNMNIAELVVTTEPVVICTVLGSCVSVCLFTVDHYAGGMIHYALPQLPDNNNDNPLRYGDYAITTLITELSKLTKTPPASFIAKIIGGADNIASEHETQKVGTANVQIARKLLSDFGIRIVGEDVGGNFGRKVLFHIKTGRLQSAFVGPGFSRPSAEKAIQMPVRAEKPTAAAAKSVTTTLKNSVTSPTVSAAIATATATVAKIQSGTKHAKKKVLIVDDSKTIRDLLCRIIQQDPELEVVGQAEDPLKAELLVHKFKPDVITLDIHMPRMTGVQWLKTLLPKYPIPVVMITSLELHDGNEVFQALELGAVDYIQKPSHGEINNVSPIIREKINNATRAKVRVGAKKKSVVDVSHSNTPFQPGIILALGASTGGTEALKDVLTRLPKDIPPTVIVQHIPPVFSRAFADRLNVLCPFEVKEAENGDALHENRVLIAPGSTQMKIIRKPSGLFVEVNDDPPMNRHKPSVDYLFDSVADVIGKKAIGVILTGMGADGAKGLLNMKNKGALTMSQDEASCVVYGMPKAAWEQGGSLYQVELENIAAKIIELGKSKKN